MTIGKIKLHSLKLLFTGFILFYFLDIQGQKVDLSLEERAWIHANPVVYFGYDPNWPPYEIYKNGRYEGVCADYIALIEKRTGIDFEPLKNMTWEKSFKLIKSNELMMVPGAGITEERKKFLIYTDNYISLPWVIVSKKGKKLFQKIEELNGKYISIPKGYMQMDIIPKEYPEVKIRTRNNFEECLQDVSLGISAATIGSVGTITYFINQTNSADLAISGYSYNKHSVAFAFPKEQSILRNIVQKGLLSINEGERQKIYSKWIRIKVDTQRESDFKKYSDVIIVIISIVVLLIAIILLWNSSLRKQINLRKKIEDELSKTLLEVNQQNNEKTILLQEIHHRVKNNLQIIISMLRLQANAEQNEETQLAIAEAIDRINSISLVHEHIYKNPNLGSINLEKYILNLAGELQNIFIKEKEIKYELQINGIQLDIKTVIPIALILNELITNSLKYAFRNQQEGIVYICFEQQNSKLLMEYKDSGHWFNNAYTKNFGTYLIEIFTEQLNGTMEKVDADFAHYKFSFDAD